MSDETSTTHATVEAASKLVQILLPLGPGERKRAITAAMVLLGEPLEISPQNQSMPPHHAEEPSIPTEGVSIRAASWMKKHGIIREQLDHVFSIEPDNIEVIATRMPGSSKRQQTVEAYIICGLKALLQTGEPNFTDKDARGVCAKVGSYDPGNHSNYTNALGNQVSGSKETGWKLSNPGLSKAAEIVKLLAPGATN